MSERKNSKNRTTSNKDSVTKSIIKKVSVSLACSLTVFFLLMILFSAVITRKDISESIIKIMPLLACAVSGFVSGRIIAKSIEEKAVIYCLVTSVLQSLMICVALFIFVGNIGLKTLLAGVIIFVFSALGAVLKLNRKPKRKIKNVL